MHYADRLQERISNTSPVCVGLDPQLHKLPIGLEKTSEGVLKFNQGIIDAVKATAAAVKLQLAYYELLGPEGFGIFWLTCQYAKEAGLIVIADGKRGDIGSSASAYAQAYLYGESPVDALTVNPYMGSDSIAPFVEAATANNKGIYSLVKTSNPGSGDVQDLPVGDEVVHEYVAQLTESWGMHHLGEHTNLSCVGAVVGATYPEELKYLRTIMPHIPFLIPGYGAQGGTAEEVKYGFISNGTGALVNASRSIIYASNGEGWQEAAANATSEMKTDILQVL